MERILNKANCIIQRENSYNLRKTYNTHKSEEDIAYEDELHETKQKAAWKEVKALAEARMEEMLLYRNVASENERSILDAIIEVIDDEVNDILLKD